MNTELQEKQIEISMEQAKKTVAMGDALTRLTKNDDFQLIIDKGLFIDVAAEMVHLKAEPSMEDEANQRKVNKRIDAIGELRQYFMGVFHEAAQAQKALNEGQEALAEIHAESNE